LDPSALLAIIAGSDYADAMMAMANEMRFELAVPTTAFQAAWAHCPPAERPWLEQLPSQRMVEMLDLDTEAAGQAGLLSATSGMPDVHLAAAHAVLVALRRDWPVVTTRPDIIQALSARVRTETLL
jgi:hypothetical protein